MDGDIFKIVRNKKNNQLVVFLSRKKLKIDGKDDPKYIKINKNNLI